MQYYRYFTAALALLVSAGLHAQDIPPKREIRGVWIATVVNIDWPSRPGLSSDQQKREFLRLLDSHEKAGINTLFVQVRPAADALYAKSREPWSKWLTGTQGKAPYPFYDPLEFMVDEAHKRGMEIHAWFNPYRAAFRSDDILSPDHITRKKPGWFFNYGGKKMFDPGIPEVRDYIVSVIMDVVRNYDIDGVHFDDYFYPYPDGRSGVPDQASFLQFGKGNRDDWRRENVNMLIRTLQDSIRQAKSFVKFGISPFGIWKNRSEDALGSFTNGHATYYEQFADSRRWLKEGWIDYVVPQLYFPIGHRRAAYDDLVLWWSENVFGKHLYIGMGAYRIHEWGDRSQMPRQLEMARKYEETGGFVFFSSKSLISNPLGFTGLLENRYFKYPAIPPAMPWKDPVPPLPPGRLSLKAGEGGNELQWQEPDLASDGETARGYVIYRFKEGEALNTEDPRHILSIRFGSTSYTDQTALKGEDYVYVVTSLDRLNNESAPSGRISTLSSAQADPGAKSQESGNRTNSYE